MRQLVRETRLVPSQFIQPLFVCPGEGVRREISSMPGNYQMSVDEIVHECAEIRRLGIGGTILFGIPETKDESASGNYDPNGIVQTAIRAIKREVKDLLVITDVCNCEYTSHGHCGTLCHRGDGQTDVDNDLTLLSLAKTAVSHARAGADIVAPSAMMDGQISAIRHALDQAGLIHTAILSYAVKFASSLYGPFRDAAESAPQFGDRRTYQMDYRSPVQAAAEAAADVEEGADMLMVKPAAAYLDILAAVKARFDLPLAAYHVSGEYSMIKAAARNGWLDERGSAIEITSAIKRAGADLIITYFAESLADWLREG